MGSILSCDGVSLALDSIFQDSDNEEYDVKNR